VQEEKLDSCRDAGERWTGSGMWVQGEAKAGSARASFCLEDMGRRCRRPSQLAYAAFFALGTGLAK
jgi:hypothetical protein